VGLKFFDWFAGIGGFRLGLEQAGHTCVGACEINKHARKIYAARFGHEPMFGDINLVRPEEIPEADLWCGGFPCQDLSTAGRRAGIGGARSGLVWKLLELVEAVRPRWLFLENVAGLISSNQGEDFKALLARLDESRFVGAWKTFDAQHFGIPQRRRRVFIVSRDLGAAGPSPSEVLFESEGLLGDLAESVPSGSSAAPSTRESPEACGGASPERGADPGRSGSVVPYRVNAAESCAKKDHAAATDTARCLDQPGGFAANQGGTIALEYPSRPSHALRARPNCAHREDVETYIVEPATLLQTPVCIDLRNGVETGNLAHPLQGGGQGDGRGRCINAIPHVVTVANGVEQDRAAALLSSSRSCRRGDLDSETFVVDPASVIPFDTTQITCPDSRAHPRPGSPCHPLAASPHPPAIAATIRACDGHHGYSSPRGDGCDNLIPILEVDGRQGVRVSARSSATERGSTGGVGVSHVRRLTPT